MLLKFKGSQHLGVENNKYIFISFLKKCSNMGNYLLFMDFLHKMCLFVNFSLLRDIITPSYKRMFNRNMNLCNGRYYTCGMLTSFIIGQCIFR